MTYMKRELSYEQIMHLKNIGIDTSQLQSFALQDLLELLPKKTCSEDLNICNNGRYWRIFYKGISSVENEDLLDAVYDMLCYFVEDGFIK